MITTLSRAAGGCRHSCLTLRRLRVQFLPCEQADEWMVECPCWDSIFSWFLRDSTMLKTWVSSPCSVQGGHPNSVHLRNQFHAALSGTCSTADLHSFSEQLTVRCSSTAFRPVSCSKAAALHRSTFAKPQTFRQAGREKQKIWELMIKRRDSR